MPGLAEWIRSGGTVAAILVAILVAIFQIRHQRRQAAVERTIAAHRDITTGEVGAARDRLSEFMWSAGSEVGVNRCVQPTWEQLLGAKYFPLTEDGQDLSEYPDLMGVSAGQTPLRDLYRILWSLERVGVAYNSGILDANLAISMLANHVVWWNVLCERIPLDKTRYRRRLNELSAQFVEINPELAAWARADFAQVVEE